MSYVFVGLLLSFAKSFFLFGIETGGYCERLDINEQKDKCQCRVWLIRKYLFATAKSLQLFYALLLQKITLAGNFLFGRPQG